MKQRDPLILPAIATRRGVLVPNHREGRILLVAGADGEALDIDIEHRPRQAEHGELAIVEPLQHARDRDDVALEAPVAIGGGEPVQAFLNELAHQPVLVACGGG